VWVHSTDSFYRLVSDLCRTLPVYVVLVTALDCIERVAEDFSFVGNLGALRLRESFIKHVLIVFYKRGVATELFIKEVLRIAQHITSVCKSCSVRLAAIRLSSLVVLPQISIESAFSVSGPIHCAQSA